FYKAKPGSAFRAQMYFLIDRQKRLREALAVEAPGPVLSDFLMEKDRIFANLNLDDAELKLYERYYESLTADLPAPDLVIYLQAKPEVLRARIAKKASRDESHISPEYIEEVARAYEHFFFLRQPSRHLARRGFFNRPHFVKDPVLQVRRTESRRDPLDAVRSSFPGGEHRRRCRLERHNACLASGFLQRARHSGDHPRRAHSAAKRRQARARLFGQFRADSHVSPNRVRVVELVGVERARLL